jgi:archaellum component FlaF (FlaF/FlaG flagellin family)
VILLIIGVHSCQVSARNSSLKDYATHASSLIQQSDQDSTDLFRALSSGGGSANAANLQNTINQTRAHADQVLSQAHGIDVPDEVRGAQTNLLLVLTMRRDGIADIANQIQPALGTSTSRDALNLIAADMAKFYASDVVWKSYTATAIAGALHAAGIAVGGGSGQTLESGQFLPDLSWLSPSTLASNLHVQGPAQPGGGKIAPGAHGHKLDSVSVNGTTLSTAGGNTIPASPPPTFTVTFTNTGANTENNVKVKVSVTGTSISATTTVPQTTPGQQATAQVTLPSSPPAGTQTVTATVQGVPGEKSVIRNTQSFPVTFR